MKLSEKITALRKERGMSQEELAERLKVSRQAVSRWEQEIALPDATNLLALSKIFDVTADYLLNDDYVSDGDLPKIKRAKSENVGVICVYLIGLDIIAFIVQCACALVLQSLFFTLLSSALFVATVAGFEAGYRKYRDRRDKKAAAIRGKFYKVTVGLGLYFPIRILAQLAFSLYPRPYSTVTYEVGFMALYILIILLTSFAIDRQSFAK